MARRQLWCSGESSGPGLRVGTPALLASPLSEEGRHRFIAACLRGQRGLAIGCSKPSPSDCVGVDPR